MSAIEGSNAEALEIEIKKGSEILGTPLRELIFPQNAIIGAIVRGEDYQIPDGESTLEAGDRVVIFALPEALSKVERFFE